MASVRLGVVQLALQGDLMFEELFRSLVPPQGAFTPEQMAEFRRQAASLPAAPSGRFFQVPASSPDRQAGQLLPLVNGQPVPEMAPIVGESDGRLGLRGAMGITPPSAMAGVSPIGVQAPPPPPPKDVFSPPSALGVMVPGLNPKSGSDDEQRWFDARGGMTTQQARADTLSRDPMMAARFDLERTMKANAPPPPAAGSPEDIVRQAFAFRDQIRNETSPFADGYTPGRGYAGPTDRGNQAMQLFLALQGRASDQAGRMDLQRLENQGRSPGGGDTFNTAKLKALEGIRTGQITPDQFGSSMKLLSGETLRSPEAMAQAVREASAQAQADAEMGSLRAMLGVDPKTGQAAAPPTGQAFTGLIDRMRPEMMPQVVAAIRAGQFGDPIAVRNAAANSLAQNYLMSQGQMPDGRGQMPGRYTIPYGDKPLMDLIATPPTNRISSVLKSTGFATSGVPYDSLRLSDGTQIPFDKGGVQGLSQTAVAGGYNQQGPAAKARLTRLAELNRLLQEAQPPR